MAQVEDIRKVITINNRRLQILKEQKALGGLFADPKYQMQIEAIEADLQNLGTEVEEAEKVYDFLPFNFGSLDLECPWILF